jgi:hypothetical protein
MALDGKIAPRGIAALNGALLPLSAPGAIFFKPVAKLLAGLPILGHDRSYVGGHKLNVSMLTALFSRSRLVRHDAPLSVRRGFTRSELEGLAASASKDCPDTGVQISGEWAFRWLLTAKKRGWEGN